MLTPRSRAAKVTARYIKPVSRNGYLSISASFLPIVLFPEAAEPSTAITLGAGLFASVKDQASSPAALSPITSIIRKGGASV